MGKKRRIEPQFRRPPTLPDGVAPDNARGSFSATPEREPSQPKGASFTPPDMATPKFAKPVTNAADGSGFKPTTQADASATAAPPKPRLGKEKSKDNRGVMSLLMLIALALAVAAAFRAYNLKPTEKLCADQPEWNQFNCRVE